ncbi:MAG: fluoride efflux transporter CrcB [Clostridium perfringens]|nr:fluoride efflux transporter CrcB [Clostridium perfringens]
MQKLYLILLVGCGGFIGAACRYIISNYSVKFFGSAFPYGTLIVNVVGAILIGFVMALSLKGTVSPNAKLFITTGIMGGLTTFSTFSYETISIFSTGNIALGSLNAGLNLFLSLGGVVLGQFLASAL